MGKIRSFNLREALEEFLLFKAANGAAERTLTDYRSNVLRFLSRFPGPFEDYQALQKAVLEYFAEQAAPATKNSRLKCLRAFFNWAVGQGHLPANPTAGIKQAKEDLSHVRHLPLPALKKLLEVPDRKTYAGLRDYCLMLVQLDTGGRPGELFQVRVSDLDLEAREIHIRPETAKTRMGRTLVLSPFTCQALQALLRARPRWWNEEVPLFATETGRSLNRCLWAKRMREYCRKAGVKVTPYGLRHSFALAFLKAGGDPFLLAANPRPPGSHHDTPLCPALAG